MITENSINASFQYTGTINPGTVATQIVDANAPVSNATDTKVSGVQYVTVGELTVIPIGHDTNNKGHALVSGPSKYIGDYIDTNGAFDAASPAINGNIIAFGIASDIPLLNLPAVNNTNADTLLTQQLPLILAKQAGNIVNVPGGNLISLDGSLLINNDTGAVLNTPLAKLEAQSLLPAGTGYYAYANSANAALVSGGVLHATGGGFLMTALGGSIVSHDGGSIVSHDGGSIVSHDGGSIVSHDGGSIVSHDGGSIVSHDGGSIVSHDGGSIVSHDGGSLISSPASAEIIQTQGGSLISSGALPGE